MEKEMKKLLLVAVSVGVFLLVTVTAAIIIVTPKVNTEETAFSSSRPRPAGRVQQQTDTIGIQPKPVITAEGTDTERAGSVYEAPSVVAVDRVDGDRLTINIPKPTTAAVPDTHEIPPAASRPVASVAPARPAPVTAAKQPAAAAKAPAAPAKSTTTAKPAATTAKKSAPVKGNDYWVQTGAFTAKVRAEDAKETLSAKGITSIIENRNVDGKTWYRVRLGPYTSEKEANYWLALVKTIDGFTESQVRQTVRQQ